jgi:hypothetical protein
VMSRAVLSLFLALAWSPFVTAHDVRIGVLGLFHPRELKLQAPRKDAIIIQAAGQTFVLEPGSRISVSLPASKDALLLDFGGHLLRATEIHAAARNGGAVTMLLTVPGKITRAYRGTLVVRPLRGEIVLIVAMDLEVAVASAVEAESGSDTPLEALKAQAVVARSYYLAGSGRHIDFDFCDLTHCQFLREPPAEISPASIATVETRGLALTFEEKPFAAMFSRSCGGHTRTPAEVGLPGSSYPYFSVLCEFCYQSPYRWTRRLTSRDAALLAKGERGRLVVDRRLGWNAVPSNNFNSREEDGQVILEGVGQGHGIGLCQRGAKAMAEEGGSFRQILSHYFPNATLTLVGEQVAGGSRNERLLPSGYLN